MKQSPESKTDTTNKDLQTSFKEAVETLKEIAKNIPEAQKEFDPIQYFVKSLKEDDLILEYRIIAHTKHGEAFNIDGMSNMPRLFDETMLPEAPTNFENTFTATITRPAMNAFMKIMRTKVEEIKRLANIVSGINNESHYLPEQTQKENTEFISD